MACAIIEAGLTQFELDRLVRIAENKKRMEALGLLDSAQELQKAMKVAKAISKPAIRRKTPKERRAKTRHQPVRRSGRLNGSAAEFGGIDGDGCATVTYFDYEPGLKDLLAGDAVIDSLPEEKQVQFQEMRCAATGRGSMYDSVAGITCHFCRQKKLCGEEDCPRCSKRNIEAECIGKTECSRCHSAYGKFCRACLLIRYGQNLDEVREEMAAGTWLCPHCYEEEHPEEGWMCNSSICMKRRGYMPTGIAIYDAQQRGFPSVAHWLQAQLQKEKNPAASAAAAPAASKPVSSSNSNAASQGEAEVATAAAAAASKPGAAGKKGASLARGKKGAAAAAGAESEAAMALISSQESRQDAAVAPGTPQKGFEAPTPGPAAAAEKGGAARRTTRGAAKAAAVMVAAVPAGKRVCVGGSAGTRKSLRFKH